MKFNDALCKLGILVGCALSINLLINAAQKVNKSKSVHSEKSAKKAPKAPHHSTRGKHILKKGLHG